MNPKVAIIVQGRANYLNDLIKSYSKCEHKVILSTFDAINPVQDISVLLSVPPKDEKFMFYQSKGVLSALEILKKSHNLFLKIRSDFIINVDDVNRLVDILVEKYERNKKIISYSASFNSFRCVQDWIIFGNYEQVKNYFTILPRWNRVSSPETAFYKSYLQSSGYPLVDVKQSDRYFDFIILDIIKSNIKIEVFKGRYEYMDIKHYGLIDKTHDIYFGNA